MTAQEEEEVLRVMQQVRERLLYSQPTGPNPLYHLDVVVDRPRAMQQVHLYTRNPKS